MATVLRRGLAALRAPGNAVSFALRSLVGEWRRRAGCPPVQFVGERHGGGPLVHLTGSAAIDAAVAARRLAQRYDLAALDAQAPARVYGENLDALQALERTFADTPIPPGSPCRVVDVGSGAFAYAIALQRFFAHRAAGRDIELVGVEIDGHRRLPGGPRWAHGEAHARLAGPGVSYRIGDFVRLDLPPQQVVTMFFPFLTAYALLTWGSPLGHLKPRALLRRAADALVPRGLLFVASQTQSEYDRLRALLAGLPFECVRSVSIATELVPWHARTVDRIGSLWRRR